MVFFGCIGYTKNKSLRYLGPFLSSNFQIFPKKQERFPKFGNFTEGKMFGRLRIPIFGEKKKGKYGNAKNCAKKILEI